MDDRKGNKKGIRGRLYIIALLAGILWTALPLGSFLYHYQDAQREIEQLVHNVAAEGAKKDMLYRFLVDELGGIYAPITEKNAPDPYLSNITDRDITTPSGKRLTLMSPDYLMRQSHETGKASGLVNGHITSLKPLRPENRLLAPM